jgi:hypothetical protein
MQQTMCVHVDNRHVEAVLEQHEGPVSSLPPLERLLRVMNDDAHIAISEVRVQQLRLLTLLLTSALVLYKTVCNMACARFTPQRG